MICFPLPVKKPLFHKQDKPHLFYIVESNGGQALLKSHLSDVIHGISDRNPITPGDSQESQWQSPKKVNALKPLPST